MVATIVLIVILLLAGLILFLVAPGKRRDTGKFERKAFAHRGLHDNPGGIPENSLAAFRRARAHGYGVELDVQLSKDGQVVVFHDDTFERMCGRSGIVEQTDYEALRGYRLDGTGERIPLLEEALRCIDGRVPLLIEVKLPNTATEICRRLDTVLRSYRGEYMIQSFNSLVLRWLKKHRGDIPRGQLSANLTRSDRTPHYLLRFCVKYLLSNCLCRPDFISYKWTDRKNPGFFINRILFRVPSAVWTLHGERAIREAGRKFDMYIFEME